MADRTEELFNIIGEENRAKAGALIHEIIFLEEQLKEIKKLPFIKVNPNNPMQQKATPAAKQYKEFLQQYNNSLRLLLRLSGDTGEDDEESPLRKWVKSRKDLS